MGLRRLINRWCPKLRPTDNATELTDYLDVLDGTGDHSAHKRVQDGKYVRCSCGTVAMGRMEEHE